MTTVRPIRALIVDDSEDLRAALRRHLEWTRAVDLVDEEGTGLGALAKSETFEYAVIILDLGLPDLDGLDLIPQLLAQQPAGSVICLTGRDEARGAVRALNAGAAAYLLKPWERDELAVFVQRAVDRHRQKRQLEIARRAALEAPGLAAGDSKEWTNILELARDAATVSKATVLIRGESGTGKEVVASLIHRFSARSTGPFVTSNVAALPPGLVESELFGHEEGSYTGARGLRRGLFELASGGTLFLDEIGDMPLELQPRLLRVLEGHPFRRLGGEREVQTDARIIAATHRDLEGMVAKGSFRTDLFYRLGVLEIWLPPLRDRRGDIEALAIHFLGRLSEGEPRLGIEREALNALERYAWPGNVRELRNAIERAAIASRGGPIELRHLPREISGIPVKTVTPATLRASELEVPPPPALSPAPEMKPSDMTLEAAIRRHIERVWRDFDGNLSRTARALDVSRVALRRRLRAYGLVTQADDQQVTTEPVVTIEPHDPREIEPDDVLDRTTGNG